MSPEQGLDELAIRALLDRYTDAVNHRDWETYRACWTKDAIWELHAPVNVRKEGIADIMTEVRRAVESQEFFVQMNHAVAISLIEADTARVRVTLNEIGKARTDVPGALPGVTGMNILAFYTDDLVRGDGIWKFRQRVYDVVYMDTAALPGQVFPLRP